MTPKDLHPKDPCVNAVLQGAVEVANQLIPNREMTLRYVMSSQGTVNM